jgi:exopolyphosphatase / guanosine-5'-triphosphate,3'-diphosphate pyrophosphatase
VTSGTTGRIEDVRVGVVDIGSNTARLLVADVSTTADVTAVGKRRAYLGLGEEIARTGCLGRETIDRTAMLAGAYAARARVLGADPVLTLVTAPGRQAAAGRALVDALERGTAALVRILSADEEGRLAFAGVVQAAGDVSGAIGVVDVGGGSTELAIGTALRGATWVRSLDQGSQRLTHRLFTEDPPSRKEIRLARDHVRRSLATLEPPQPDLVFATGGSARAAARIAGRDLDADDLDEVLRIASRRPAAKLAKTFQLHPHRARTLLAGALLLAETSRALGRPLVVSSAGMREGAAVALAYTLAAEAA